MRHAASTSSEAPQWSEDRIFTTNQLDSERGDYVASRHPRSHRSSGHGAPRGNTHGTRPTSLRSQALQPMNTPSRDHKIEKHERNGRFRLDAAHQRQHPVGRERPDSWRAPNSGRPQPSQGQRHSHDQAPNRLDFPPGLDPRQDLRTSNPKAREFHSETPHCTAALLPVARHAASTVETCVICCEPAQVVAIGSCQHIDAPVCARCCLRQRMCYNVMRCPLCNAEQEEVIITATASANSQRFTDLEARRELLWQHPKWAKGVLVDDAAAAAADASAIVTPATTAANNQRVPPRRLLLHVELQVLTSLRCPGCPSDSSQPFPSSKALLTHVAKGHPGRRLCHVCIQAKRDFPLELTMHSARSFNDHFKTHPNCDFCRETFFGSDELYCHMQQRHFSCEVCQRMTGSFVHFQDAAALVEHLGESHHLCEDPECEDCFVAFPTLEQLRQHRSTRHSQRMPRFQRGTARRFDVDFGRARSSSAARPSSGGEGGLRDGTRGGLIDDDVGLQLEAFPGLPQHSGSVAPAVSAWEQQQRDRTSAQAEMQYPALAGSRGEADAAAHSAAAMPAQQSSRPGLSAPSGIDVAAGRATPSAEQLRARQYFPEEFDDDDGGSGDEAAAASQRPVHSAHQVSSSRGPPPPLVRQTVKCPCGRRSSHLVLQGNQHPQPLQCDRECEALMRRNRLADAFGVADPDNHTSVHDRPRVTYSPSLLVVAQNSPTFIAALERHLNIFLLEPKAKRYSMPPMPREQRKMAHQLAEAYGLTTLSLGNEPHRHLEIIKSSPSAAIPANLLSEAARAVPVALARQMEQEARGYSVILVDVIPGFDVEGVLSQWQGAFTVERPCRGDVCEVRFTSQAVARDALRYLGGGIRGKFRVDPSSLIHVAAPVSDARNGRDAPISPRATHDTGSSKSMPRQPRDLPCPHLPSQQPSRYVRQRGPRSMAVAGGGNSWTTVQGAGGTRVAPPDPWDD